MAKLAIKKFDSVQMKKTGKKIVQQRQLFVIFLLPLIYFAVFHYAPMYGVIIAFKNYKPGMTIMGADWVGFSHFVRFFNSYEFERILKNTLQLSLYSLVVGTPIPILLAIVLNEMGNLRYKKFAQLITYAPHFISSVVMAGMIISFTSPSTGIINTFIELGGGEAVNFMAIPEYFKSIYVWTNIWQNAGWSSIIYIAALAGVDPGMYESAKIDGASRLQKIRYIDIPSIMPTIVTLLIMSVGRLMTLGYQQVLLLQNSLNLSSSQIIQTYVYQIGLLDAQYSYSAAIGLFNNIINLILLVSCNTISKKVNHYGLW